MSELVYGNSQRIFINTALGCSAMCRYCYLSKLEINSKPKYFSAETVIKIIERLDYFEKGKNGTIISIGCYSECWDSKNIKETIKLISYFAKFNNYIQFSTKKEIDIDTLQKIEEHLQFKNQLGIFISIPTISRSEDIEPGTDLAYNRISILNKKHILKKIYFVLYIKPVLVGITILDIELYKNLVLQYSVDVVAGTMLSFNPNADISSSIGEGRLEETGGDEVDMIHSELKKCGQVYYHSTDIINSLRRGIACGT